MNATIIDFIPKKANAKELKDFRPIVLIEGTYKLISKLLIIDLSPLWETGGRALMVFLKGRQIMDALIVANEHVDSRVK